MKEQNKTPEKELHNMEMSNLLDADFKTLVIRMLQEGTEWVLEQHKKNPKGN